MNIKSYIQKIEQEKKKLLILEQKTMPVKAGNAAKNHFRKNFRQGGYIDHGITKWPKTRRQMSGLEDAGSKLGPLLSSQLNLFNSIHYVTKPFSVTVLTTLKYAPYHNWGATIPVTKKSRGFFWSEFYREIGDSKGPERKLKEKRAAKWKWMALSKKTRFILPQRKFMDTGNKELEEKIQKIFVTEIRKIMGI